MQNCSGNKSKMNVASALIKYFPIGNSDIIEILKSGKMFITGSVVLRELCGIDLSESDIDLVLTPSTLEDLSRICEQEGYSYVRSSVTSKISILVFVKDELRIDIFVTENPVEFIESFNLSHLMNWFDGENIHSKYPECTKNMEMKWMCEPLLQKYSTRQIDKSKSRGFTLVA
jgi:hypothetical protein